MRRPVVIGGVLLVLAFVLVGGPSLFVSPTTSEIAPETAENPNPDMVRPTGDESGFWPYLNSRQAFQKRSPINVVVIGETETVIGLLVEPDNTDWEKTDENEEEADPNTHAVVEDNESDANNSSVDNALTTGVTAASWTPTTGATRYAYVDPGDGEDGQWVEETAQIHDGTYYGHRYHIRMYESPNPDEPWVAMQTHHEHFDWFTLRHRVHGSQAAQARLEADLMDRPQVDVPEDVNRDYLSNENAKDADGWATFVDLVGMTAAGLGLGLSTTTSVYRRIYTKIDSRLTETDRQRIAAARDRVAARQLILAGTIVTIVIGVRIGGIALERIGLLSMHGIAAVLYPFIGVGLPVGTYLIANGLERRLDSAVVASSALAVAIWLDYGLLGVTSLPIDVIIQRMLVVIALGLIAGGAAQRATRDSRVTGLLLVGTALWVVLLTGTLLGYL